MWILRTIKGYRFLRGRWLKTDVLFKRMSEEKIPDSCMSSAQLARMIEICKEMTQPLFRKYKIKNKC